jgi:hypothetical protein
MLRVSFNRTEHILKEPVDKVIKVVGEYFDFCMEKQYPVNKIGLICWLGCGVTEFNKALESECQVSFPLQKALEFITQIRISMTDEGKINPIWNMFILANDSGYSRSDSRTPINIQINNQGYTNEEYQSIIEDIIDLD